MLLEITLQCILFITLKFNDTIHIFICKALIQDENTPPYFLLKMKIKRL